MSDHPPFTLRALEPEDAVGLTELLNMPGVVHGTLRRPFMSVEANRKILAARNTRVSIVAVAGDRIVGEAGLNGNPNPRRAHVGELGMAVRDDFRRRGVGDAMLSALIVQARDWLGLRKLQLEVYADNAAAIALYEKHGFETEGLLRADALREGVFVDTLVMGRLF
ncbi:MAG: GNAT family N-acetyltransferase [Paracoccus sp. (in: a-proteobacteria)]|nr:GNAT family N-acetyltransferase [Paracoccus sp. (in: a-proteobacteria)]